MLTLGTITDALDAEVEIKHPATGAPLGAFVRLAGPEHPTRKELAFARARKLRAQMQKAGRIELGDPAEEADEMVERLVRCVLGWRGINGADGGQLVFSTEAARTVIADPANAWLRDQLQDALEKRELFIGSSALA